MKEAFREWLQSCHATLDKSLRFEELAGAELQTAARQRAGVTLFRRCVKVSQRGRCLCVHQKPVTSANASCRHSRGKRASAWHPGRPLS